MDDVADKLKGLAKFIKVEAHEVATMEDEAFKSATFDKNLLISLADDGTPWIAFTKEGIKANPYNSVRGEVTGGVVSGLFGIEDVTTRVLDNPQLTPRYI